MCFIKKTNSSFLSEIAEILISKTLDVSNIGLLDGKAGIALFFYKYSAYINNQRFKNFADLLIDNICEEISSISSFGFSEGLSGIGWCFAYLFENNFLNDDTDEILLGIDEIIIKRQSQHCVLHESSGEIFGTGIYCLSRLYTPKINRNTTYLLSKTQNVLFLIDECENMLNNHRFKNYDVPTIRPQTLISIGFFLLEVYKLGLDIKKVKILLSCMPRYFESSLQLYMDKVDRDFILTQINEIILIIDEQGCKTNGDLLIKTMMSNKLDYKIAIGNLTNDCCKNTLYNLIYKRQLSGSEQATYLGDIDKLVNNKTLTEDILRKLHNYNLGLNGGLAGLGLTVLETTVGRPMM